MRELHVIVHEDAVKAYADMGAGVAQQVLDEIRQIKASKEYLELHHSRSPNNLHPDMPPASEDLQVVVSGGYKGTCCTFQLFALREAGYKARFHPTANCPGQGHAPSILLRDIDEKYPDFYD